MISKILLIDDDNLVGFVYSRKLREAGYDVRVEADGKGAQKAFSEFLADLLIIDIGLPDVNGLEILRAVRETPGYRDVPVIVLSNSLLEDAIQEAFSLGATEVLDKANCSPPQMIELVGALIADRPLASPKANSLPLEGMKQAFWDFIPGTAKNLSEAMKKITRSGGDKNTLLPLYNLLHPVAGYAGVAGYSRISRLAEATEALIRSLYETNAEVSASACRTLTQSIDVMTGFFDGKISHDSERAFFPTVLLVEDDKVASRLAIKLLERVRINSLAVDSAEKACDLLEDNSFSLFILDGELPGMSGDEFCRVVRSHVDHAAVPVVFVTSLTGFEFRTQSVLAGGNDLIGKPYNPMELAVKVLTQILLSESKSLK